jgi:multiple antibiotic resistance protein
MLGAGEIFTLLFVTLGPLKLLGPFFAQTRGLEQSVIRRLSFRAFVMAVVVGIAGGLSGRNLAIKWRVSTPALVITVGVVLFLVAIRQVMEVYEAKRETPEPLPKNYLPAAMRVVFPGVLTPYGLAALIGLLSIPDAQTELVLGLFVAVAVLDLLAMLLCDFIMKPPVLLVLQVLGAVLGVLQVALAVQFLIRGLRLLGTIGPAAG